MRQFNRKTVVAFAGREYNSDEIDINFTVDFDTDPEPNVAEVEIYNVSGSTIALVEKGQYATLSAGYVPDIGIIASGTIEDFEVEVNGPENILRLYIGDGASSWGSARIQRTFAPGTRASTVMKALTAGLALETGAITPENDIQYPYGIAFDTSVAQAIRRVAEDTGSKFIIRDGVAYFRPIGAADETGFVLNAQTGLLGSPERTADGARCECLLNNKIRVDTQLRIESKTISGTYRVLRGTHYGDFITEVEVAPI